MNWAANHTKCRSSTHLANSRPTFFSSFLYLPLHSRGSTEQNTIKHMRRNDQKSWLFRGSTCLYCITNCKLTFQKSPAQLWCVTGTCMRNRASAAIFLIHLTSQIVCKATPKSGRGSLPAFQVARRVGSPRTPHIPRRALSFCSPLRTSTLKVSCIVPTSGAFPYDQIPASQKESIKICLQDYDFKVRLYFSIFLSVANPQTYENSLKTNLQCFYWKKAIGKALTHWAAGNFAAEGLV